MKHRVFNISLFVIYIAGMTGLMIWQGIGIDPSRYVFVLLLASLLVRRTRSFILDWIPFLFILLSYDFLRGFAGNLGQRVHFLELINWEMGIFGQIPTITLQSAFYHPSAASWLNYFATMFYFLHFALRFFKLKALWFLPYVLLTWLSLVYLGEHYVVDIIAGAIYAIIFYFVAVRLHVIDWGKWLNRAFRPLQRG